MKNFLMWGVNMYQQIVVLIVISITLFLFIDGRIRYDFVSILGLMVLAFTGVIAPENAFLGFGHPAVITVASVLVISSALTKVGVTDHLVVILNRGTDNISLKIMSLMIVTAILSGFMNNIGALALILPIALTVAKDSGKSPSKFLMPVAFASLLGGMLTAIGTPSNLIVSSYRVEAGYEAFSFFAFAPVGIVMVVVGVAFITIFGWRLIPMRKTKSNKSLFNIEDYLSEVVVREDSKIAGKSIREFYSTYKLEVNVLSIIRNKQRIYGPNANEQLIVGDVLIIKTLTPQLADLVEKTGLSLKGAKLDSPESIPLLKAENVGLVEVVLRDDSLLIGRTALETRLRNRFNVNLIAVSRKGEPSFERLKSFRFKTGDILLMQVPKSIQQEIYTKLRCLPLAERELGISGNKSKEKQYIALGLFIVSIIGTSLGLVPVQLAFSFAAVLLVVFKILTPREFYEAIEWPAIIMLGSLLPLGGAIQSSGAADTIAKGLIKISTVLPAWSMVTVIMILTIIMTNLISNTATTVLMAPIAFSLSKFMGVSPDALLMCVAVASSTAFLTPIGHQSNMLVMGPGGYKFTDYWKLGLPLAILIVVIGTPLILYVWPF